MPIEIERKYLVRDASVVDGLEGVRMAQGYIADNGILVNPLLFDGYGSVGCAPCTRRIAPGEDARAGRWSGSNKVECGLH